MLNLWLVMVEIKLESVWEKLSAERPNKDGHWEHLKWCLLHATKTGATAIARSDLIRVEGIRSGRGGIIKNISLDNKKRMVANS